MECDIVQPHVNSYDAFYTRIDSICRAALREQFRLEAGSSSSYAAEIWLKNGRIEAPSQLRDGAASVMSMRRSLNANVADAQKLLPAECRQRGVTYGGALYVTIGCSVDGRELESFERSIGTVPIMLCSTKCHLRGMTTKQLYNLGEEPHEIGGYFVVNGSEKILRVVVTPRRNFPIAMEKARYRDRGPLYSPYALSMRMVRDNHTAGTMFMHYLESCQIIVCLVFQRQTFFVPLIYLIKALTTRNDRWIYETLLRGRAHDSQWRACVGNMLSMALGDGMTSQKQALALIGSKFRVVLEKRLAPWLDDKEAGDFILKQCCCIHLDDDAVKLQCLISMAHKLMALVRGEILTESQDNPQFQEALTPGDLMSLVLKERLEIFLTRVRQNLEKAAKKRSSSFTLTTIEFQRAVGTVSNELTRALDGMLATGNVPSLSGLALPQQSGYAIVADRINQMRFLTNFRAIHRGSFFQSMRTTDVRKLRPEAWGFVCPVHTPDGGPCGLLNHLTAGCRVVTEDGAVRKHVYDLLEEKSCIPLDSLALLCPDELSAKADPQEAPYMVWLDGAPAAYVRKSAGEQLIHALRKVKLDDHDKRLPYHAELTFIARTTEPETTRSQYPGVYIFTEPSRLIRPVYNCQLKKQEWIGTFEQVYMNIAVTPDEATRDTLHQELAPTALFSFAALHIPYPDHNQSPRNVYQCQMGKQTMGVPCYAWHTRNDNKMFRLLYLQQPLVAPKYYEQSPMKEYPLGTNAIIAVCSYTGYDMEDAMCINKASYQRGFGHGHVFKCETVNLVPQRRIEAAFAPAQIFSRDPTNAALRAYVDTDGLPIVGRQYKEGEPYLCILDIDQGKFIVKKYKSAEKGTVTLVRVIGLSGNDKEGLKHVIIQWRLLRNPIIGDKFASRHGQKGINSFLWPQENMPFSETGMVPDLIFNPHGYPSRMTIGMMIETMAGKAAAAHAWHPLDATPFVFDEKTPAIEFMSDLLQRAGYNYLGNETMYSGVDGRPFEVEIFFGVVYYQRLRHMVADKYQVRAMGPVDAQTKQPVKGRKRGGGIRFGEMERDAIIAHGCSYLLRDRLMMSSDKVIAPICQKCGSLLSVLPSTEDEMHKRNLYAKGLLRHPDDDSSVKDENCTVEEMQEKVQNDSSHKRRASVRTRLYCTRCMSADYVRVCNVPYVLRYLAAELLSANVRLEVHTDQPIEYTQKWHKREKQ